MAAVTWPNSPRGASIPPVDQAKFAGCVNRSPSKLRSFKNWRTWSRLDETASGLGAVVSSEVAVDDWGNDAAVACGTVAVAGLFFRRRLGAGAFFLGIGVVVAGGLAMGVFVAAGSMAFDSAVTF